MSRQCSFRFLNPFDQTLDTHYHMNKEEYPMEPTSQETAYTPPKRKYYPAMTGEERLEALRAIRGMWKGKAVDMIHHIEQGREDRDLPPRQV
jgi:hypothetical protein